MDKVYKIPVEMGMNGTYSFRISDPQLFFVTYIGTNSEGYELEPLREIFLERTYQAAATIIHEGGYPYIEVDAHLIELSDKLRELVSPVFAQLGLELTDVRVSGTQFDEGTLRRISRVSDVTADTLAASEAGLSYEEMQRLQALRDAARNEGGLAGAGIQMGVGLELGRKVSSAAATSSSSTETEGLDRLRKLKILLDEGIITQEDYDIKKQELLKEL